MFVAPRALLALLIAACFAVVTSCTVTTHTSTCHNNECTVNLSGGGSETTLFDDAVSITLDGSDGDSADLTVNQEQVSCSQGDTKNVDKLKIICDTVGDDEVQLTVVG